MHRKWRFRELFSFPVRDLKKQKRMQSPLLSASWFCLSLFFPLLQSFQPSFARHFI